MTEKELIKNLKLLKDEILMSDEQKDSLENLLMSKIKQNLPERNRVPLWLKLADRIMPQNFALQPTAVFGLILGLFLIFSFASVNAAKNTLPGDTLYPVKIAAENIKYNLTFSDGQKAKIAMSMVENRVNELKMIVASQKNSEKERKTVETAKKIKSNLDIVKDKVQKIDEAEVVKEIDQKLAMVKEEVEELDQSDELELEEVASDVEKTRVVVAGVLETEKLRNKEVGENEDSGDVGDDKEVVKGESDKIADVITENATSTSSSSEDKIAEDETIEKDLGNNNGENKNELDTNTTSDSDIVLPELIIEEIEEKPQEFEVRIGE